jgi:hypothetical protein
VDVLGGYGPLFFSTTGICTSYYFVFSINLVDFILSEYLGMSRNVSECTPKVENDHMNLLEDVQDETHTHRREVRHTKIFQEHVSYMVIF